MIAAATEDDVPNIGTVEPTLGRRSGACSTNCDKHARIASGDTLTLALSRFRQELVQERETAKRRLADCLEDLGFASPPGARLLSMAYRDWLSRLPVVNARESAALRLLAGHALDLDRMVGRIEAELRGIGDEPPYREAVEILCALSGLDRITALAIACEIGDIRRFPSALAFVSYLGLSPDSSTGIDGGRGKTRRGHARLRRLFFAASAPRRLPASAELGASAPLGEADSGKAAYVARARLRMEAKYRRLIESGKPERIAIAARARELAAFAWGGISGNHDPCGGRTQEQDAGRAARRRTNWQDDRATLSGQAMPDPGRESAAVPTMDSSS